VAENRRASTPRTRIQQVNQQKVLDAALEVFSAHGFRGATLDQIAELAGLSKPNLLYYFPSKEADPPAASRGTDGCLARAAARA
jgi:TetR/AcrR family transcriptional regulator